MALYIQHIEIDNFKSFSGVTSIPFETGFTTISGPNGSGKSNIIDSILFCLGLSTSRTLRAEKLTDLINHSSRRREAKVTITFASPDKPEDAQLVIARAVRDTRQSGYSSTYYLNGKTSTLGDVQEKLSEHNISAHAYNVLMQGDVTGIINMSAYERRKIIDELAGVSEFDRKTDQAEREIETVAQSIERSSILRAELETRVDQLKADREQALKYQALREEKQELESQVKVATYRDMQDRLRMTDANIKTAQDEKKQATEKLERVQAQLAETDKALREISDEVKRKGEDQQIALKKQIEGLKGSISRKEDAIRFGQEKRGEYTQNIKTAHEEIERLQQKQAELKKDAASEQALVESCQKRVAQRKADYEQVVEAFTSLNSQTAEIAEKQQNLMQQLRQDNDALAAKNRELLDVESEKARLIKDKDYASSQLGGKQGRLTELNALISKTELDAKTLEIDADAFRAQVEKLTLDVAKTRVALTEARSKAASVDKEMTRLEAQKRAYEETNLGRSVDAILNANLSGVRGSLSQLMQVEADVALAIETALGGRVRSVVVDNDKNAQDCIEFLKRANAGRATFLPMNKIRGRGNYPLLPDDEAILGYAIDLVKFDSEYEGIFSYALGDTVVFENMSTARRFIGKFRMVTLDGAVLEKTGAMTGGAPQRSSGGLLMAGKIEQELKALEASYKVLFADEEDLSESLAKKELSLERLKQDAATAMPKAQEQRLTLAAYVRERDEIQSLMKTVAGSAGGTSFDEALQVCDEKQAAVVHSIEALQKTIKTLETQLADIEKKLPADMLAAMRAQQDELDQQLRTAEAELRHAQGELQAKTLENDFLEKGINNYNTQIKTLEENIKTSEKESIDFAEEIELLQKQIKGLIQQAELMDKELVSLQNKRDEIQAKLIEDERQKFAAQQAITSIQEQILSYQARAKELREEMGPIKLELVSAGIDIATIETLDLKGIEEIQKRLQSIQRKMEAMGDVNMRAISDYDEVQKRLVELSEKLDTLDREKNDLQIKIQGYTELKKKTFFDAFENVNIHFKEIFGELSDGDGQLVLTNPESPFEGGLTIEAQPRGKKTLRLESMSGGEKSLTALAFVFAFQRYLPAPFYAFDEVDMFLDGINAEKLSQMVRKQSDNAQFIVVSLRKPMLSNSDFTVGVTQRRDGVSKLTGIVLKDDLTAFGGKGKHSPGDIPLDDAERQSPEATSKSATSKKKAS